MDYDAVVVGAGPVGGYVAGRIAEAGFNVALLEEHHEIGEPVQCGGLVTPRVFDIVEVKEAIVGEVRGAEVFSPSGRRIVLDGGKVEAVVVDRAMFDRAIVKHALKKGATSYLGTQASSAVRESGRVRVKALQGDKEIELTCKILVGADGVRSDVAKWFGILKPKKILPGFEAEMVGVEGDPAFVKLFVGNRVAPGFFGWIIPSGDTARVGLCTNGGNAFAYLKKLLQFPPCAQYVRKARPICYIAGGIPLGFPRRTYAANVMVVGDAACHPKATSGGGIFTGLLCATHCANTATDALTRGDFSEKQMHKYHKAWTGSIGKELRKDLAIHESFTRLKDQELEEIFDILDNPTILELIRRKGDIDFPSKVGWALLREEPRLLKYMGKALRAMILKM